jgi:hypothetical protein
VFRYAHFELRRLNLDKARKILGTAIGLAPKPKSFKVMEFYTISQIRGGHIDVWIIFFGAFCSYPGLLGYGATAA